jgi:GNAT superfamily N-acetyltransferase
MTPSLSDLLPVITATWPSETSFACGPFRIARNTGGGNRVRAARLLDPAARGDAVDPAEIDAAEAAMADLAQPLLFMVLDGQRDLDAALDRRGYEIKDRTLALCMPTGALAAPPPPVTCFEAWPPLGIQEEVWAKGGIGAERLAVMARASGPKISLFGRSSDKPAGSAFVGVCGDIAMLHALEVLPGARRSGLASHIMRAAAHWAQDQGATLLSVLVTEQNRPGRALYASLGFQAVGSYWYRMKPV